MSELEGPEALHWLLNNKNKVPFAGNRFHSKVEAVEAVKRLYAAGATRVHIDPYVYDEPWRIKRDGGPYADGLTVTVPKEKVKEVLKVIRSLRPMDVKDYDEMLDDPGPLITRTFGWD